jgi:hypothetical protein
MSWRLGVGIAVALVCSSTWAGSKRKAIEAYRQGMRAQHKGNYQEAAEAFIRCDLEFPREESFEMALKAGARSNVSALVMYLVSAAEARQLNPKTTKLVRALRERHNGRVGKLQVDCGEDSDCSVHIREQVLRDGQSAFLDTGSITVQVHVRGEVESQDIEIGPSRVTVVRPAPPTPEAVATDTTPDPSSPSSPELEESPLKAPAAPAPERAPRTEDAVDLASRQSTGRPFLKSPAIFWIGAGATALVTTTAVVSGLDTSARWQDFLKSRAPADKTTGVSAQGRTNILWICAGAVAVSTAITALFVTEWFNDATVAVAPRPGGAMVAWETPW